MRNPSRTRAALAVMTAMGALIGTLVALSDAHGASVASTVHGATIGTLAGSLLGLSTLLILLSDCGRLLRR